MKIYVASSWRNGYQPMVVRMLLEEGYEVYDFRNPEPGDNGFSWSEIDPDWKNWTDDQFLAALDHEIAVDGFGKDFNAMEWADACVMVGPCGTSSHTEMGWFTGKGKPTAILLGGQVEPELMIKVADYITPRFGGILKWLSEIETRLSKNRVELVS